MVHPKDSDYPLPNSQTVTNLMKANKRSNTKPEIAIRSLLHKSGFRFRKDLLIRTAERKCRPDIVFTRARLAVFLDGCFWHLCPEHGHIPKSNVTYWEPKLKRNRERDRLDTLALESEGWKVLRIWEHTPVQEAVDFIATRLQAISTPATDE